MSDPHAVSPSSSSLPAEQSGDAPAEQSGDAPAEQSGGAPAEQSGGPLTEQTAARHDERTPAGAPDAADTVREQIEQELKFAPRPDRAVPDLSGLVDVVSSAQLQLRAVYFDSPDYRLARAKMTLRRRTGGADAGWHLKLPKGSARTELHVDLADGDELVVPQQLLAVVRERLGQIPLIPVAVLSTERTSTLISERRDGPPTAELCDDRVTATRFARPGVPAARSEWREIEVELVEAGRGETLLGVVSEAFADAGIQPAASPSKLARALGSAPAVAARRQPNRKTPLVDAVLAALAEHIGVLQHREVDIAADAPDAVHKARVASRRLRSILKTFSALFDASSVTRMRAELKWYATRLGYARDAEVQRERLPTLLDDLPAEAVSGDVRGQMIAMLDAHHEQTVENVRRTLTAERYRALRDALLTWLQDPPLNPEWDVETTTGKGYRPFFERAVDAVRRQHRAVLKTSGAEQLAHRHEVRKKAKIVRYVCEALTPALGTPAADAAAAWEDVTEHYGELNDAAVAREWIRRLADRAEQTGQSTFTYGVLFGMQLMHTENSLSQADAVLETAFAQKL